jgi:hypothetical protein
MAMTFLDAGHHSQIEPTQEEMLAISREISLKFSPNAALIVDNEGLAANIHTYYIDPEAGEVDANTDYYFLHNIDIGFSPKELNDISLEISRQFAPKASTAVPELFLLPVDPSHLYAYWDLGESIARITPEDGAENCLILRIYWRPDDSPEIKSSNVWFDVAAGNPESRQKVRLPIDDTAYSAALGKLNPDNNLDVLATSNIIRVPPAPGRMRTDALGRNQDTNRTSPDSPIAPAGPQRAEHAADKYFYEDALIDSEIKGILYEKMNDGAHFPETGWFVKLHFGNTPAHGSDASKIDSELMAIFNAKGIGIELIPESGFIEPSNVQGNNASGRGM